MAAVANVAPLAVAHNAETANLCARQVQKKGHNNNDDDDISTLTQISLLTPNIGDAAVVFSLTLTPSQTLFFLLAHLTILLANLVHNEVVVLACCYFFFV